MILQHSKPAIIRGRYAPFFYMKIKVLKAVAASGKHLEKGKTYDVSDYDGQFLIDRGKATEAKTLTKSKKTSK